MAAWLSTGTGHAVTFVPDKLRVIVSHNQIVGFEGQLAETTVGVTERVTVTVGDASGSVDADFVDVTLTVTEEGPDGGTNSLSTSLWCDLISTGDGRCS